MVDPALKLLARARLTAQVGGIQRLHTLPQVCHFAVSPPSVCHVNTSAAATVALLREVE